MVEDRRGYLAGQMAEESEVVMVPRSVIDSDNLTSVDFGHRIRGLHCELAAGSVWGSLQRLRPCLGKQHFYY